jgi:hypothetical protein
MNTVGIQRNKTLLCGGLTNSQISFCGYADTRYRTVNLEQNKKERDKAINFNPKREVSKQTNWSVITKVYVLHYY